MISESDEKQIRSTKRSMKIMEALFAMDKATNKEIANQAGLAPSTTHYHLNTLEEVGYVTKEGNKYSISMKIFHKSHNNIRKKDIYREGKNQVDELGEKTGELSVLMTEQNKYGYYIHEAVGENAIDFETIGSEQHLHCNAVGKSTLAFKSEEEVNDIIDDKGLPQRTKNTVTNCKKLKKELREIRERGVAFDNEEYMEGLCCVGSPIYHENKDNSYQVYGAIGIALPASRATSDYFNKELPNYVREASNITELKIKGSKVFTNTNTGTV